MSARAVQKGLQNSAGTIPDATGVKLSGADLEMKKLLTAAGQGTNQTLNAPALILAAGV